MSTKWQIILAIGLGAGVVLMFQRQARAVDQANRVNYYGYETTPETRVEVSNFLSGLDWIRTAILPGLTP